MSTPKTERATVFTDRTLPNPQGVPVDDRLAYRRDFEGHNRLKSRRVWSDFSRLIVLSCLLLCALVVFPLLYMHHLTELAPLLTENVTDATGSVFSGGILWRPTCYVCLLFLLMILLASFFVLGGEGCLQLITLALAEMFVTGIIRLAISNEPGLETSKECRGDVCLSNGMFYASVVALIVIVNLAVMTGVFRWKDDAGEWNLRGEFVDLRDMVRSRLHGYQSPS